LLTRAVLYWYAAVVLGLKGAETIEAAPALIAARKDQDGDVCGLAAYALNQIDFATFQSN